MHTDISELVREKIELMKQGKMVDATERFYAEMAKTIDFTGVITNDRDEMVKKMIGFLDSIARVNAIKFHNSATNGDISFVEFTFDFEMKDGSRILWHEVIRSIWKEGKIVEEQFFKA